MTTFDETSALAKRFLSMWSATHHHEFHVPDAISEFQDNEYHSGLASITQLVRLHLQYSTINQNGIISNEFIVDCFAVDDDTEEVHDEFAITSFTNPTYDGIMEDVRHWKYAQQERYEVIGTLIPEIRNTLNVLDTCKSIDDVRAVYPNAVINPIKWPSGIEFTGFHVLINARIPITYYVEFVYDDSTYVCTRRNVEEFIYDRSITHE